ncbi:MAG: plastocyanin [Candidatus Nanohaloarchaea archaeon]|jgi:plastocyanin
MEDKKEKIRELRENFEVEKPDKTKIAALALTSVFVALAITAAPTLLSSSYTDTSATVNITEWSAEPAQPMISEGEKVRFVNNADSSVRLEFEQGAEDFELEPGQSTVRQFEMSVYYSVVDLEQDPVQRINAGIAVE